MMTPPEFALRFKKDIRVILNWEMFFSCNWPLSLCYFSLPKDADRIYTPWYVGPDGSNCAFSCANGSPQSVLSASRNHLLRNHHEVQDKAPRDLIQILPAYRLDEDHVLLLDGNHRVVSSQISESQLAIVAFVIDGPITDRAIPDLKHWM